MEEIEKVLRVPMSEILADSSFNSRGQIAPYSVFELAKEIKENGLLQPITIQPWDKDGKKYRIVCGHRRFMAFQINSETHIPCLLREDLDEEQAHILNLSENISRENLNIMQEARAIEWFLEQGWYQERIASKLGVHPQWVGVRKKLLTLEPEIQARAESGMLTQHQINDIARLPTRDDRMEATRKAVDHKLRGEKKSLKLKKEQSLFKKKARTPDEIFELQDTIRETIGNNFGTRCLAWAAGVISLRDIYEDLERIAAEQGVDWEAPDYVEMPT